MRVVEHLGETMEMTSRKRISVGIAAAVVAGGALVTGIPAHPAAAASVRSASGISFTSSPAQAAIVAHYAVTPAMRAEPPSVAVNGSRSDDQLPDLSPKQPRAGTSVRRGVAGRQGVGPGHASTPSTIKSFIGQQASNVTCSYFPHGCNPPDQAVAASPLRVIQGVNTQWQVWSTSGAPMSGWPVSGQRFFHVPNVTNNNGQPCDTSSGSQPFLSDPRVLFDSGSQRFIAAMLQVEGGLGIAPDCPAKTVYYIAVSQTADPDGSWNVYEFDMSDGQPFSADFTMIGFTSDAIYFSANMFANNGNGFYAEVFEANKAQMEAGTANFTALGFRNMQGTGPGTASTGPFLADTVQPAQTVASKTGSNPDGLFIDTVDGPDLLNGNFCSSPADACTGLILWRMHNPIAHDTGGANPSFVGTYVGGTLPFSFPPPADEPTCNQCVDASDLRISATPAYRNGILYAGWDTGINNGTHIVPGIEWAAVDTRNGAASLVTSNYFNFSGDTAATYPALMPEPDGGLFMVYERMGHAVKPEARFVAMTPAETNFPDAGRLLKGGEASYRPSLCGTSALPVCRWGDYEAVGFDGVGRIWFAGEYANSHTDPNTSPTFGRNWGTWIGEVKAGSHPV